jgi:hypothetical protein
MKRGASLIETVIVALVLLLVARSFGFAITLYAFAAALAVAALIVAGFAMARIQGGRGKS